MPTNEYPDQHTEILPVGAQAPNFTLRAVMPGGKWEPVSLSDSLEAGRTAVIVFFPMAFSPSCTAQVPAYSKLRAQFEALGADIYGISRDNPYALREWSRKLDLKVPVLSDLTLQVAGDYGVALPHRGVNRRATFVVDAGGMVRLAEAEHDSMEYTLEAEEVLAWIQEHVGR